MTSNGRASQPDALPDLAYIVRPGENEELRYSLRSVAKHTTGMYRRVWIAGTVPDWARNIGAIPLSPQPEKFANQRQSLYAVVTHPEVAPTVVVMNDDHFLMRRIRRWPVSHLGPTSQAIERFLAAGTGPWNTWLLGVQETAAWVTAQGIDEPLCYENHTPLPFRKDRLREVMESYPARRRFCYPGVYPLAGAGPVGQRGMNCKVSSKTAEELAEKLALRLPWLSGNEMNFADGALGEHVRAAFPDPSPYEEA